MTKNSATSTGDAKFSARSQSAWLHGNVQTFLPPSSNRNRDMTNRSDGGPFDHQPDSTAERLQAALDRSGLSPRAASLKAGLSHGTVAHILRKGGTETPKGKTSGANTATLAKLASVLGCSLAYLTGESTSIDDDGNNNSISPASLTISGYVESGHFRPVGEPMTMDSAVVPGFSDPRLPKNTVYRAFRIKDKMPSVKGVDHNDVLIFAEWHKAGLRPEPGMVVITRRTIGGGRLEEISLRTLRPPKAADHGGFSYDPPFEAIGSDDEEEIVGLVLTVQKPMW